MQILLLKDVKGLGRRQELKEVSDGYARNFLIPKGMALAADEKGMVPVLGAELQEPAVQDQAADDMQAVQPGHGEVNGVKDVRGGVMVVLEFRAVFEGLDD